MSEIKFEASSDLIHRVCGILDVNAIDVHVAGMELSAVYSNVGMLEHSCLPNTSLTFDKCGHISVCAARKIAKLVNYTLHLKINQIRKFTTNIE